MDQLWWNVFMASDYGSAGPYDDPEYTMGNYEDPSNPNPHWSDFYGSYDYFGEYDGEWVNYEGATFQEMLGDFDEAYGMDTATDILDMSPEEAAEYLYDIHDSMEIGEDGYDGIYLGMAQLIEDRAANDYFDTSATPYGDWAGEWSKYVQSYNPRQELLAKEQTDAQIDKWSKEYGDTSQLIASQLGKLNLASGRSNDLWSTVKDSLDLKIEKGRLQDEINIAEMQAAYIRQFYGDVFDVALGSQEMLDPDFDPDE